MTEEMMTRLEGSNESNGSNGSIGSTDWGGGFRVVPIRSNPEPLEPLSNLPGSYMALLYGVMMPIRAANDAFSRS